MLKIRKIWVILLITICLATNGIAQDSPRRDADYGYWDGGLPLKPTRVIEFDTDEGTNMSLDVSPDGKTIVFDLLGDLYVIPIDGGKARRFTSGIAFDSLPRFSPDGKCIAFVSDRSGLANIWTVAVDGSDPRKISQFTDLMDTRLPKEIASLAWSPDGRSLITVINAAVRFDTGQVWRFDLDGGKASDLTPSSSKVATSAVPTPDGAHIWYSYRNAGIERLDLKNGEKLTIAPNASLSSIGDLALSPDGRRLVYSAKKADPVRRGQPTLQLRDPQSKEPTEEDIVLTDDLTEPDGSQFAFTPDSKSVVYTSLGKIKRIDLESRNVTDIPFVAKVRAELAPLIPTPAWEFTGPLKVKQMRSVNSTADGKHVVFSALGKIWKQANGAKPRRLTTSDRREYDPVLSPNGRSVAFVTWSHHDGSKLWKMPTEGGEPVILAASKEAFTTPRWTPDGSQLIALRVKAERTMNGSEPEEMVLIRVDAEKGGQIHEIAPALDGLLGPYAQYLPLLTISADGQRVYFMVARDQNGKDDVRKLYSVRLDGSDRQEHARFSSNVVSATPSPDGRWLAIQIAYNTFVMPFPEKRNAGEVPLVEMKGPHPEPTARQLTREGGGHPMWSADGKWLSWSWANRLFRLPYSEAIARTEPVNPQVTTMDLTVPRHEPKGRLLLTSARVVTMAASGSPTYKDYKGIPMPTDPKVIERGDILVEGGRIKAMGPTGSLRIPMDTKTVDLAGKTIVPGYIATHEHRVSVGTIGALVPEQEPFYAAYLAEGFTTNQDPWYGYSAMYADEMVEAGELVGPRWVGGLNGTIPSQRGENYISDYAAADAIVRKHKNAGAYLIKEYGQPHRVQRQWLAIAAAKYGIRLAGDKFGYPAHLGKIFDGWSMVQHNLPGQDDFSYTSPNDDIRRIAKAAGTTFEVHVLAPSLRGPITSEFPRLLREWDRRAKTPKSIEGQMRLYLALEKRDPLKDVKPSTSGRRQLAYFSDLLRSGCYFGVGTEGRAFLVQITTRSLGLLGGLTTAEQLRMLTINGARTLHMDADIGSIEPGKMADMVVLNSNPLDDFANARDIKYVMKSGEVYDSQTLDVLWPSPRKFTPFPWAAK